MEAKRKIRSRGGRWRRWATRILAGLLVISAGACEIRPPTPNATPMTTECLDEEWSYGGILGRKITTSNYCIYTTSPNRALVNYLPGFMEAAYINYHRLTDLPRSIRADKAVVYVLADRPQWAMMTEQVTGPRKDLYLSIETGGYCLRGVCVLWDLGHYATFSIASHEGLHQFLHRTVKDGLPAWTEEGLAVMSEGIRLGTSAVRFDPKSNAMRKTDMRRALTDGRWIPLEKLLASDAGDHVSATRPEVAAEYYGHLWAMLQYIRSKPEYRAGLGRMIADAKAGRLRRNLRVPPAMGAGRTYVRAIAVPAFKRYITEDMAGFEESFRQYARQLVNLR